MFFVTLRCKHKSLFENLLLLNRLGESEGSYCTLATFPSESSSSSSSENSSPSSTPPSTPLQEKQRKVQKQQKFPTYGPPKQKNGSGMAVTSLCLLPIPTEVSCDILLNHVRNLYVVVMLILRFCVSDEF